MAEEASEQEETTESKRPEHRITKSPDYKMIYVNGLFGNVTPLEGRMTFFADRLIPKIIDEIGSMRTDYIERELQIEVKMSPTEFVVIYNWMKGWVEKLKSSEEITFKELETVEL